MPMPTAVGKPFATLMTKPTFYITTAIDYPNAKPHLGHAYEKIIADCIARWHKQLGEDVYFLTGTDEHGQKIEKTAASQGKKPKQFVDEMVVHFQELLKKLNISNNDFIRTTESRHAKTCKQVFQTVLDKGLIHKGTYEGLYCPGCEAYYTEKDLVNGLCPAHQKAPEKVSEESYFFKLSQFQDFLLKHFEQNPQFLLPESRRQEIVNRLKEGLKDLSVSRKTIKWGIPLPNDKQHVIYVWFDALLNYISALGGPEGKKFKKYWPVNVHVIGKDIAWFHAIIWPAILQAAGIPLPKTVHAHGWVTMSGEKMSKSLGTIIDPVQLVDKYGADAVRYFFLREIPSGEDGDFNEQSLIERSNADLGDTLGNLLQRTSVLIHKNFNGQIPKPGKFTKEDKTLVEQANKAFAEANALMQKYEWHKAVETIWTFLHACNKYVNDQAPWNLTDQQRLSTVLYILAECLRIASILTWPFIPAMSEKISSQLGQNPAKPSLAENLKTQRVVQVPGKFKQAKFKRSTKGTLAQPEILFKKIETITSKNAPSQAIDPFRKLMLRVGVIEDVQPHPNAEKLYVLKVNLGAEKRQLVAGIKPYYQPDQLKGKHVIVVANLKPAMLRGIESQGMLLAAQLNNEVKVLQAPQSEPGTDVFVEGLPCEHDQITIDDFAKVKLTTHNGKAVYNGKPLKTSKEEVTASIGDNATIR